MIGDIRGGNNTYAMFVHPRIPVRGIGCVELVTNKSVKYKTMMIGEK